MQYPIVSVASEAFPFSILARELLHSEMPELGYRGRQQRHKRDEHSERTDDQGPEQTDSAPKISTEQRPELMPPRTDEPDFVSC
jgi:hypothetical protein